MVQSTALPTFLVSETDILAEVPSPVSAIRLGNAAATDVKPQAAEHVPDLSIIRTQDPTLIEQAQRLRYQSFFGGRANSWPAGHPQAIDQDEFDQYCEHLVVLDNNRYENGQAKVVGTYRLRLSNLQQCREQNIHLYTATEFDLQKLMQREGTVLELGRSCVHPDYRSGDVIRSLWSGIGEFLATHQVDYMIGCVSFPEANVEQHFQAMAYINQYHAASNDLCPEALPQVKAKTATLPSLSKEEGKVIFRQLPPLLKAYIRMGARFGDGAVLDNICNTLDLCVIVDCKDIDPRYSKRFIKA